VLSPSDIHATVSPGATRVSGEVVLVHDYLNQRGGAERVALELAQMHPEAPLYTSLYRPATTFPAFDDVDVRTSFLQHLPVNTAFRGLFPLYPLAFRSFGTLDADVVISSSSAWAHAVRTSERAFHAVYCYTPARWLYGVRYMDQSLRESALKLAVGRVRAWDQRAASRPDLYIAISRQTQARIKLAYGFDAPIVYPPVDLERFTPRPRGERLLVVSRLLPYKRVDAVVAAATELGIGLDVVGVGPELDRLRAMAGPSVAFHGAAPDRTVTELMESCRAVCLPGEEDFGLTPVEAHAAGKPVIAFGAGGALETVEDGFSGVFFGSHDSAAVADAVRRCDALEADSIKIAERAQRFSRQAFRQNLTRVIEDARSRGPQLR
jgi:glycosyltransferase involved in cell wall biosynthesis